MGIGAIIGAAIVVVIGAAIVIGAAMVVEPMKGAAP